MPAFQFTLNGKPQTVDVVAAMPLLWVLRDTLGMTGTKFGCGMALCGACTVHVNGQPMRVLHDAVSSVAGKNVTTIEGLSPDRSHPVQRAWIEEDVPQCGYCQSGQIMTAAALLAKTAQPTDADIDEAMRDNICRCGTYQSIRRAMHRAAQYQAAAGEAGPGGAGMSAVKLIAADFCNGRRRAARFLSTRCAAAGVAAAAATDSKLNAFVHIGTDDTSPCSSTKPRWGRAR